MFTRKLSVTVSAVAIALCLLGCSGFPLLRRVDDPGKAQAKKAEPVKFPTVNTK
jgi:hypothetical protein